MTERWSRIGPRVARVFCLTVGPFLVLDGITGIIFAGTGLSTGSQLPHREWNWFFDFNDWHHLLHVITGGMLVLAAVRASWLGPGVLAFGAIYLVLTPLAVIDGDDVANVVYSDARDNVVHGMLALEALGLGLVAVVARRRGAGSRPAGPMRVGAVER